MNDPEMMKAFQEFLRTRVCGSTLCSNLSNMSFQNDTRANSSNPRPKTEESDDTTRIKKEPQVKFEPRIKKKTSKGVTSSDAIIDLTTDEADTVEGQQSRETSIVDLTSDSTGSYKRERRESAVADGSSKKLRTA